MQKIKNRIEQNIGSSLNITKCIQKEGMMFFSVKDKTLINLTELQSMPEIDSIELNQNRLKVILKQENEENVSMAKIKNSDFHKVAQTIIANVGGKENINGLRHCITRVRFKLKDESKANDEVLNNTEGVISVVKGGGEYMVVIGNHVGDVYEEVCKILGINEDGIVSSSKQETNEKKQNPLMKALNVVMGAVGPALNLICAGGVLKGLLAILGMVGLASDSGIYILSNAMGDAVFYFLPLFLGYNMAKNQGGDGFLGLFIGCILVYPAINGADINLFGYVVNATYTSSFLPVILIVAIAVPISKFLKNHIPAVISGFLVPVLTLLLVFPIGFAFVGPFANFVGGEINNLITSLMSTAPIIGGAVFAGLYQVMVLFGIHSALTSFSFMNVLSGNPDAIMALSCYVCFAQIGVVLAMYIKSKDMKLKSVALPAFISGVFGVTEPAIYGVTLPHIKMFVISCIGAAIGGAYAMATGVIMHSFTGLGVVTILGMVSPENPDFFNAIMSAIVPFIVSFIMAYLFFKENKIDKKVANSNQITTEKITIEAPIHGKVVSLSKVEDETFSSGMMGHGLAIDPDEGKVYAPFDGTCVMVFETLHAIGLKSDTGVELLIHVGIDTVSLNGKPFKSYVTNGDSIKKGQLLLEFDIDMIHEAGLSTITPVLVTNEEEIGNARMEKNTIIIEQGGE